MTRQRQLKYRYTRSKGAAEARHPHGEKDYTAWDGETVIGRVYWSVAQNAWVWHAWFDDGGPVEDSRSGSHPDKIGACKAMEDAYDGMAQGDG